MIGLIAALRRLVAGGALNAGVGNALLSKLQSALASLVDGNANAARNKLLAFINQVNALVYAGTLSASDGQFLIDAANRLIAGL